MENKVRVWLARDKDGDLYVYPDIPLKNESFWSQSPINSMELKSYNFPSVQWEDDEPTEAYITLAELQEQPKQEQPTPEKEIDWEQRRYEIAKDILSTMFFHPKTAIARQEGINFAVKAADMLINKLKEKSE